MRKARILPAYFIDVPTLWKRDNTSTVRVVGKFTPHVYHVQKDETNGTISGTWIHERYLEFIDNPAADADMP